MIRASVAALLLAGCVPDAAAPRTQALVFVDTDAPVPRMVDRLRLATYVDRGGVLEPQCDGCAREIPLAEGEAWPISFGVVPADGARVLLRATLYQTGRTARDGAPAPATAIDVLAEIRFAEEEVREQRVRLPMDCAGSAVDLTTATTCLDATRRAAPAPPAADEDGSASLVGTWHAGLALPCDGSAAPDTGVFDGEVCIPGGTFWMGDIRRQGLGPAFDGVPEHPVAVSTFHLDRHEYSVGRLRRLIETTGYRPARAGIDTVALPGCNWDPAGDGSRDDRPLNCVQANEAAAICAAEGRRLPTEAEWEWAAGGREAELLYPWGHHEPETWCWIGSHYDPPGSGGSCEDPADWGSHGAPVDAHPLGASRDGALDLSGNVAEWVADVFQLYTEPCWAPGAYGPDPRCDPPLDQPAHGRAVRGSSFSAGGLYQYPVSSRGAQRPDTRFAQTGFRCAR